MPSVSVPSVSVPADYGGPCGGIAITVAHLPADVTVTGAHLCRAQFRRIPGDGRWRVEVDYAVTTGLDGLVAAYEQPDQPAGDGPCATVGYVPLLITFTTLSGDVVARQPTGTCGAPLPSSTAAYWAAGVVELSKRRVSQVDTELSETSGCPPQFKDMLRIEQDRPSAGGDPRLDVPPTKVCVYRDDQPGSVPGGHLLAAVTLPGDVLAGFLRAAAGLPGG